MVARRPLLPHRRRRQLVRGGRGREGGGGGGGGSGSRRRFLFRGWAGWEAPLGSALDSLSLSSSRPRLRIYDTPPEALQRGGGGGGGAFQAAAGAAPPPAGSEGGEDSVAPAVRIHAGELVYDYAWYPRMSAGDAASCCLASAARAHPVHLWDACTGESRPGLPLLLLLRRRRRRRGG